MMVRDIWQKLVADEIPVQNRLSQKPSRKVALLSLHRTLNDVVFKDNLYLDQLQLFHSIHSYSSFFDSASSI